jgi:ribosomal-protein-alanine N-acetyltransferase
MKLETARLLLKDYTSRDLNHYFALKSCKSVWTYSTYAPLEDKIAAQAELNSLIERSINDPYTFGALFLKEPETYIGEAGILSMEKNAGRCVLGYNLLPEFWNRGYATEITTELVRYAFSNLKAERVEALAQKENMASRAVLEKSGFLMEGILRHYGKINGKYVDVCCYAIISEDYKSLI